MKEYQALSEIQSDLHQGVLTCVTLVQHYLKNIHSNSHLNVFVEIYEDEALKLASHVDQKIKNGTAGKLAGMVIGLKDVLSHQGHALQAGSQILNSYVAPYTATAVQRLLDEDAIVIGRQNCDEFAMGSSNENSSFGPVLNAKDTSKVPGGSSGGSAVAVQAGLCHASIGSDTGGSVRQPASFCGVVGLKPSYGRISRWGLIAYASSFDSIGPITKSVQDAGLLLEVMAGADEFDSTVSEKPVCEYSKNLTWEGKARIAYIRETIENDAIAPDVKANTLAVLNRLKEAGHEVVAIEMPLLKYLLPTYYILTTAEASSNLSRFDGVRYGHRTAEKGDLTNLYKKSRTEGFGEEVRRRILLGTFVLSANYYDAYYTKAQRVRRLVREESQRLFSEFDFLISPVSPTTAYKIGEKTEDPLQMYLGDIFTVQANVVGNPAISIPNGEDADGMPIGIQIMGSYFGEQKLLSFADYLSKIKLEGE